MTITIIIIIIIVIIVTFKHETSDVGHMVLVISGSSDTPSMSSGMSIPAMCRMVGAKSIETTANESIVTPAAEIWLEDDPDVGARKSSGTRMSVS